MKEFEVIYLPIGVPTFHLESAREEFRKSCDLLNGICDNVRIPEDLLLSLDALDAFMDGADPDLLVIQNITFANAAYAEDILGRFPDVPILLWGLREPVIDGGRLRLNSLTGSFSAANMIRQHRKEPLVYVFGSPSEEEVADKVAAAVKAAKLKLSLKSLKLAQIGDTPQGFAFGRATDEEMDTFGVRLENIAAEALMDKARGFSDEDCKAWLDDAMKRTKGLDTMPEKNRNDFVKLYRAYAEYAEENGIGALGSRCWPDFFTEYGTPVCTVLSILNDLGIASACEADAYGALSMYMGMQLTGQSAFFGDPVSMDEKENTVTFWHCGMAACSLAREDTGAACGEHCNRHIGPTMEFGCKPAEKVTIFRVGKAPDGHFRFFIASGKAPDKPKQFFGTSIVVQTDCDAREMVESTIESGFEPHFAVIYGDAADALEILAHYLDIEVIRY